jgi:hypothetical protein
MHYYAVSTLGPKNCESMESLLNNDEKSPECIKKLIDNIARRSRIKVISPKWGERFATTRRVSIIMASCNFALLKYLINLDFQSSIFFKKIGSW